MKVKKHIYVKLLNEGTIVYRPIPAFEVAPNIFELQGFELIDHEDEEWQFQPGSRVVVEEKTLEGDLVLVAKCISDL